MTHEERLKNEELLKMINEISKDLSTVSIHRHTFMIGDKKLAEKLGLFEDDCSIKPINGVLVSYEPMLKDNVNLHWIDGHIAERFKIDWVNGENN